MNLTKNLIRSPLFRKFLEQKFWHADSVDLVWRHNGNDVVEEADWLKDLWYLLMNKIERVVAYSYMRPIDWVRFYEEDTGQMMQLRFGDNLPLINLSIEAVAEHKREWFAETMHRQIDRLAHHARSQGIGEVQDAFKAVMGLK